MALRTVGFITGSRDKSSRPGKPPSSVYAREAALFATGWSFASVTYNTVLRGPTFIFLFFPIWFLVTTHWEVLIYVCTFRLSITCCSQTLDLSKWNFNHIQHIIIKMVSLYNYCFLFFCYMLMEYVVKVMLYWEVIVMVIFIHFKNTHDEKNLHLSHSGVSF